MMNRFIIISILIFLIGPWPDLAYGGASNCHELKWTKQDGRTQAGGWIWFPGKAIGRDLERVKLDAEVMALESLRDECQMIHKEVKFNERCVEIIDGGFIVYVRAAIEHKWCEHAKAKNDLFRNLSLEMKVLERKMIKELGRSDCKGEEYMELCIQKTLAANKRGDYDMDDYYSLKLCEAGRWHRCELAGFYLLRMKDSRGLDLLEIACEKEKLCSYKQLFEGKK
jgi:hypothetical protein